MCENVTPLPEWTQARAAKARGPPCTLLERGPQWGQVGQEVKAGRTVRGLRPTPPLARQAVSRATCIPTCGKRARGQRVTVSSCSAEGLQTSDSQRATLLSQEVGTGRGRLCPQGQAHLIQYKEGGEARFSGVTLRGIGVTVPGQELREQESAGRGGTCWRLVWGAPTPVPREGLP